MEKTYKLLVVLPEGDNERRDLNASGPEDLLANLIALYRENLGLNLTWELWDEDFNVWCNLRPDLVTTKMKIRPKAPQGTVAICQSQPPPNHKPCCMHSTMSLF